jgi:hypothetical protein
MLCVLALRDPHWIVRISGAVCFVLLTACCDAANLRLARNATSSEAIIGATRCAPALIYVPPHYWVLVASTSSSTEGANIRSSTACGSAAAFRTSIARCRPSGFARELGFRSTMAQQLLPPELQDVLQQRTAGDIYVPYGRSDRAYFISRD